MKQILPCFTSKLKFTLIAFAIVSFISEVNAQAYTYSTNYFQDAGNPGGVNTEGDAPGLGTWNDVIIGPQATNVWSGLIFLPFPFDFYGEPQTVCFASQNGVVKFGNGFGAVPPAVPGPNFNLPSVNFPDSAIGFWDEFTATPSTGGGDNIRTNTFGTAPNRQFWIKWYSFEMGNPTNSFSYFAIVLEETTNKIYIVDQYSSAAPALTATVGVQLSSSFGVQIGDSLVPLQGNGTATTDNDYWEFTPELLVTNNAGISALANPTLPLSAGLQNVDVTLENYGTNTLDSVMIAWEVDGIAQTGLNYTTAVPALGSVAALNIGTYNFPNGFSTFKAWTSMPNGVADSDVTNDTLEIEFCTALDGTYTIGASSTEFPTIDEAVDALNTCGVAGPVVFNVDPGTYTGGYILNEIIGASATNTITFDGGNAAFLDHDGTGIQAVWSFQGADYVTIKNFTITHTGTTDSWGVHLQNSSDYNTIDSCIFNMNPTPNLIDVAAIVASGDITNDATEGDNGDYNTFSNNQINGGEYGIHLEGSSPTIASVDDWMSGITISNNTFDLVDDYAIYGDNLDSLVVHGNTIANMQNALNADALYFFDIQNFEITANTIFANDWGIYIADGNFDGPAVASASLIANNMVNAPNDYAVYLDDVNDVNIYHNTLKGEPAIRVNDNLRMDVRNNVLVSDGDYAFESDDNLLSNITTDYNMYWTPALNTFFVKAGTGVNIHSDLVAWQTTDATNNVNSLELEPNFVSPTDFHMILVNGYDAGDNSAGITVDIDGDTRPLAPTAIVDMGADEWTPNSNDVGVSNVDNPFSPLSPGVANVEVSVQNFGINTVDSVMIEWEINGTPQTPLNYTTAIPSASVTSNIALGSFNFPNGFTNLKAWTSMPNGGADGENNNDTLEIDLCTALTGTYTVGGGASDFADIQEAVDALLSCGVSGPTVIEIQPGTYNGGYILTPITGTSATNTVTFDGGDATSTFLAHDGTGIEAVWSFQGAEYVTLKNMDITHTGTVDSWGVHFQLQSNFNTVDSCVFNMNPTPNLTDVAAIVASGDITNDLTEGDNGDYLIFSNNQINGGEYGIHLEGSSPTISSVDDWMSGIQILNNTFNNVDDYGIYLDNQDSITITGNTMTGFQNAANADAIYCFDIQNFDISSNFINAPDWGIYIADGNFDGPTVVPSLSTISNNMVVSAADYAVYLDDVNDVNIFHNSFSGNPAIRINDNLRFDVRNNVFVSDIDFAFESDDAFGTNISADYNLYWTPSTNGSFAKEGTATYTDLSLWQAANTTNNVSSIEVEPLFVSATDLHRLGSVGGDLGDNTVGITVDIDGDTRPLAPSVTVDMGADEYTPNTNDAALTAIFDDSGSSCGDSTTIISVAVQNLGLNNITSLPITLEITGAVTETVNFTYPGNIAFGSTDTVAVHILNTYAGGIFNISGYVSLAGDADNSNDSIDVISLTYIPFEPTAINGSVCGVDSGLVYADSTYTTSFDWYDAPTGGNLVGSGTSFTVPSISTQNTYFLEYGAFSSILETTYADDNGCGSGNMFDINSSISTSISSICVNTSTVAGANTTIIVHYIVGSSYVGNETNPAVWTTQGTYNVPSAGTGNATCFTLTAPINIPSGATVAMYIEFNARYTNLPSPTNYTDPTGNITVTTGAGFCNSFSGPIDGRAFNGSLTFGVTPCSAIRVPASIPLSPTADLGADTSTCDGFYTLSVDSSNAGFEILWSNGDTTLTSTITTSGTYSVEINDAVNGCIATDTVVVSVSSASTDTIMLTGCDSLSVLGMNQTTSGFVTDSLTNSAGCDSLVVYDVTILNTSTANLTASICMGASLLLPDGSTVDTAGTYVVTIANAAGCDSIITTIVDMFPLTNVSISGLTPQICDTAGVINVNLDPLGGTLTGNGISGSTFDPAIAGLGFTTITYEVADSNGCDFSASFDVEVVECIVGIKGITGIETISVYPNPYSNSLRLIFEDESADELNIRLFDALGRNIISEQVETTIGTNTIELNIPDHAAGVTFIQFERNGKTYQQSLLKK